MKEWRILEKAPLDKMPADLGLSKVLWQLLYNRGLSNKVSIDNFLNKSLDETKIKKFAEKGDAFYDPFLFRDMEVAVEMIIRHIKAGNLIIVYGDYDADGVTSSVILMEALKMLHAKVDVYLPDRVTEGYGLNKMAIKQIASSEAKLIITVDNGIRNKAEVEFAKENGLEVIITDHHVLPETKEELPDCPIIDPADKDDNYPCAFLAGVGVAFKLISALLFKSNLEDKQRQLIADKCLDLVAVGTIADLVSLLDENRLLVERGLKVLNKNKRLGLSQLIDVAKVNTNYELKAWNVGWQIGPRLNAASRLSHANTAFALLTTEKNDEAKELAEELNRRNISRQEITKEITAQVERQIDQNNVPEIIIAVALEGEVWNEGVIGLVAGKIAEKYYRPTLIITRLVEGVEFDEKEKKVKPKKVSFKGSGRSIPELNLIETIEKCSDSLDKYGGHPMACGFSIDSEEKLLTFKDKIINLVRDELAGKKLIPKIEVEAVMEKEDINISLAKEIEKMAPYGQSNQQPKLVSYGLEVEDIAFMGKENQHIKIRLSGFWALSFGNADTYKNLRVGDKVDVVYFLEINNFNNREEVQLKIVDLKFSNSE